MYILKQNTTPEIEIVPRKVLDLNSDYVFFIRNEYTNALEQISSTIELLPNENYKVTLDDFPTGKINEKFTFELKEENEIVLIGQFIIVDENENVQDYSKQTNSKYYQ